MISIDKWDVLEVVKVCSLETFEGVGMGQVKVYSRILDVGGGM